MNHRHRTRPTLALAAAALSSVLVACSGTADAETGAASSVDQESRAVADTSGTVFDDTTVHSFAVEIDEDDYRAMVQTYLDTGDKEWISGTVTIDGQVFEDVGLKLKGNSSLRGVSTGTAPETLPWRIELDEFVEGQDLDGYSDFVVRANTTETSLNEAVALDLLEEAGMASEHAVSASFTVNGSAADLRLVLQNLDDDWDEQNFGDEGILYKADADGDYSYRGDDPTVYSAAFDVDAGAEDYAPLTEFLDFVNNADDAEFAAQLGDYLEVEEFARYLAFEDLISNFDDIDGPGNNSFLRWDAGTGRMTVVAWDHNLAFGTSMGGGMDAGQGFGGGEPPEGFTPPSGVEPPEGFGGGEPPEGFGGGEPPEGFDGELPEGFTPPGRGGGQMPGGGGPGGGSNVLVQRFQADEGFAALYDEALADLRAELVESGTAEEVVDRWAALLTDQGGDLVDAATVESDAARIEAVLSGGTAADGA